MNPRYGFSYHDFQVEVENTHERHLKARRQFKKLARAAHRLFHVKRSELRMPLIGTLKLRICFSDRHQVPTWTMVKCMANDYLFDLPVGFFIITGLDYWTPDGEPEYHYGIHLEMPPCSPN